MVSSKQSGGDNDNAHHLPEADDDDFLELLSDKRPNRWDFALLAAALAAVGFIVLMLILSWAYWRVDFPVRQPHPNQIEQLQ